MAMDLSVITAGGTVFLGDFVVGAVVVHEGYNDEDKERIGHILHFTRNNVGELILFVRWDNGEETPMHPGNILLLQG